MVTLPLYFIKWRLCHDGVWGAGGITIPFLTSTLDGEWSASHPGSFTPAETDPSIDWVGPKGRSGRHREEKISLPLSVIEPRYVGRQARSLVAISSELSQLKGTNRRMRWLRSVARVQRSGHCGWNVKGVGWILEAGKKRQWQAIGHMTINLRSPHLHQLGYCFSEWTVPLSFFITHI
jgi:hypothetical protein